MTTTPLISTDGKGILIVDGTPLTGGKQLLDGIYYNIRKDGDTQNQIIIKNWSVTNNLNISLMLADSQHLDAVKANEWRKAA
jgi:hypothetical protein